MIDKTHKLFEKYQVLEQLTPAILNSFVLKIVVNEKWEFTSHYQFVTPLISLSF
ncbi:DUF4368 domain-containing protein [Bacillus sp. RG28]|uniref:DUF4368 domain-containing protein n=1 Tax=Gottfriedia endophytica TaxID=2820819 RepID=A0A940NR92_9BACI|nr:DUF4368 domain-containing protein [Gottfriedia endophytica]